MQAPLAASIKRCALWLFVFCSLFPRHVSGGPVRIPGSAQRHWKTDPEWLKCHSAERQQSSSGSWLEVRTAALNMDKNRLFISQLRNDSCRKKRKKDVKSARVQTSKLAAFAKTNMMGVIHIDFSYWYVTSDRCEWKRVNSGQQYKMKKKRWLAPVLGPQLSVF